MEGPTIFSDRGEVGIEIEGVIRPARPSYEAQVAIEQALDCSIDELFLKARKLARAAAHANAPSAGAGFKLREMAVVITECIRAAGKARNDTMLQGYSAEVVGEKIAPNRFAMNGPVTALLTNMLFGGADPKKAPAESAPAA